MFGMKTLNQFLKETEDIEPDIHAAFNSGGHLGAAGDHARRAADLRKTQAHLEQAAGFVSSQRQREHLLRLAERHGAAANAHEDAALAHHMAHNAQIVAGMHKEQYEKSGLIGSAIARRQWKKSEKEAKGLSADAIKSTIDAHETTDKNTSFVPSKPDKEDMTRQPRSSGIRDIAKYHAQTAQEHESACHHLTKAAEHTPDEQTQQQLTNMAGAYGSAAEAHREAEELNKKKHKRLPDKPAADATAHARTI